MKTDITTGNSKVKKFTLNFHSIYSDELSFHCDEVYSFHQRKLEELFVLIKVKNLDVDLTFDGSHLSDLHFAVPLLLKYDLKASFFVIAEDLLTDQQKWEQYKKIHELGFDIGSHAYHHVDLTRLNTYELLCETFQSKKIIEDCISASIWDFSVPYGKYNKEIADVVLKSGYKKIYTTDGSPLYNDGKIIHRWSIKNHHSVEEIINVIEDRGIKAKFFKQFLKLKHLRSAIYAIF